MLNKNEDLLLVVVYPRTGEPFTFSHVPDQANAAEAVMEARHEFGDENILATQILRVDSAEVLRKTLEADRLGGRSHTAGKAKSRRAVAVA